MSRSIRKDFQYLSVVTIIITMVLLSGFWIYYDYQMLQFESNRLRTEHMNAYKNLLRDEVHRLTDNLSYEKVQTRRQLEISLIERTNGACDIAQGLLEKYRGKLAPPLLHNIIKDSLRGVRLHNGRGYYFAINMDGTAELFPTDPEQEGRDLGKLRNANEKFIIRDMLEIANTRKEGFYSYTWSKPNHPDTEFPKITYIKLVPGLNWIIGTGEYLDDVKTELQEHFLNRVEQEHFGKDKQGYFFVGDYTGMSKTFPAKGKNMLHITDANGVYIVKDLIDKAKNGGGFVPYVMPPLNGVQSKPKLSYATAIPDWEWYVGAGVYIDEIDSIIEDNAKLFQDKVAKHLVIMGLVLLALLLANFLVTHLISRKIWDQIQLFSNFLKTASTGANSDEIRESTYMEFREIAYQAGELLRGRNRVLQDIRLSRDEWVNTFNAIGDCVLLVDPDGYIVQANQAAFEMLDASTGNLINSHYSSFCCSDNPISKTLEDKQPHTSEFYNDILERILLTSSFPIINENGKLHKIIHIARDITQRKKLEEQLAQAQKMKAIGLLAGGVAHDLNNILSGVVSYPDLILPQLPEDSKIAQQVKAIQKSGQHAADIVADLLTLARGVASNKQIVNLRELIEEQLNSPDFTELLKLSPDIEFSSMFSKEALYCNCSAAHIKKSIMNIMINGAEAVQGEGKIHILTERITLTSLNAPRLNLTAGFYAKISISDTGSGIPPGDIERIFEPFYTKKTMGKRSGSGLGLAVVWNTIREHAGTVEVSSSSKGTVFNIYLPLSDKENEEQETKLSSKDLKGKGETILFVDDEAQQRDLGIQLTRELGYIAEAVENGEKALIYLKRKQFDLVILDMILGSGMNGRKTYEKICELYPQQKALIVSGFSEDSEVQRAQQLGAGYYLKKPYTLQQLGEAIKKVLGSA